MNKKSKLDLLVRVRYSNPLPPPPCPPKLLNIPTDPQRYTKLSFTNELANETPLPMVIDAECGMPLDLLQWDSLWTEGPDDPELNPDPNNLPQLDPKDAWLAEITPNTSNGASASSLANVQVPWLRKTEYIGRETVKPQQSQEFKALHDKAIDVSIDAQIRNIEKSFDLATKSVDLKTLRYPGKPNLRAVESWEILPDESIWANAYDLFKFSERPGERPLEKEDPRLDCALLRPMESEGEHFLAYYLMKDDQSIAKLEAQREAAGTDAASESQHTVFHFIRDYETVKIEQDIANEFLLVFADEDTTRSSPSSQSGKAAFYKNLERKINLKKKRVNRFEVALYTDKWDAIQLSHAPFSQEELDERTEAAGEVMDPLFMFRTEQEEDVVVQEEGDDRPDGASEQEQTVNEELVAEGETIDVTDG